MPGRCPDCGSSNVIEDDLYSQRQWVCEDCGSVVEEGHLTTTISDETQSRAVPYHVSTDVTRKPCRNLIAGFSRVRALCRILRLSANMESEAVGLFERAYNHPNFLHVTLTKKEVLGGCCILFVCRRSNWPVAMGTISYLLGVDTPLMGGVFQEFTQSLNIETTANGIIDLLESFCYEFKLGPNQVDEALSESPQRLVERTSALIEVAADTWIVTGRRPLPLLVAAVFVAWQSLNPQARMKYTFSAFCKIGKAPEQSWSRSRETIQKRLGELREVLCKLGRELPWLRGRDVEPNTVATLVGDILRNYRALLMRAANNYQQQLAETQTTPSPKTAQDTQSSDTSGKHPEDSNHPDPLKATEPKQLGADQVSVERENVPGKGTSDCELPPTHWGKRHLFLPPCVKSHKRQRMEEPLLEVTGNEDISDSEIESYIRSQDEVKLYLQAQNELNKS